VELILEWFAVVQRAKTSSTSTSRIATLNDEAWYEAVEDGTVVVAIETVLEEVA
jgi:hypothetical protein